MSISVWKLDPSPTSSLEKLKISPPTLDAGTQDLPAGGYTTFRTFHRTHVLRLVDHFSRLEETAGLENHPVKIDRSRLRAAMREAIEKSPEGELRVRLILDLSLVVGTFYILTDLLHVPSSEEYEKGVRVVTRHLHRENPKAKRTDFVQAAEQVRQTLPPGMNEAVMIGDDGRVLEGLSSNFFAVWNGEIWTAEQGVLSGITRTLVLESVRSLGIPLRLEGIPQAELKNADEMFITSTSRAVLPVTEIDGAPVGMGKPGPVTRSLLADYQRRLDSELTDL